MAVNLGNLGDKVDGAERAKVESALSDLRTAMKSDDKAAIDKKAEALAPASAAIAQQAYAGAEGEGASGGEGATGKAGARAGGQDDNVVDAEFEEVKDDKKAS